MYNGVPIRVFSFCINNISASSTPTATIRTNEASPTILWAGTLGTGVQGNRRIITVPIPFKADKGLEVISSIANSLSFTFVHTQTGS